MYSVSKFEGVLMGGNGDDFMNHYGNDCYGTVCLRATLYNQAL